jgi:sulfopyruvate decarboxylase TPP-binding subunit
LRWSRFVRREARSIPAAQIVAALKSAFRAAREASGVPATGPLGWVLCVPDAQQETLLAAAEADPELRVLPCASEDEAQAIAAGLWIGGEPSILSIQHAGLYASLNAWVGIGVEGRVPLFMIVGLRGRDPRLDPRASRNVRVQRCEPLLETFGIPHARLERRGDVHRIPEYFGVAQARRGPAAVLVGRETC